MEKEKINMDEYIESIQKEKGDELEKLLELYKSYDLDFEQELKNINKILQNANLNEIIIAVFCLGIKKGKSIS